MLFDCLSSTLCDAEEMSETCHLAESRQARIYCGLEGWGLVLF